MSRSGEFEALQVQGEQLVDRVKALIHEGNVRRIVIKQGEHTIVEMPLTVGVVGAVLSPMLAVVSTLAALLTDCTIEVEREPITASHVAAEAGHVAPMGEPVAIQSS